uniref:Uncharacterized protein n=1 Tax=mine drainage metagenome TaxID=410659 RepID=E6QX78_9ZZZZ
MQLTSFFAAFRALHSAPVHIDTPEILDADQGQKQSGSISCHLGWVAIPLRDYSCKD